MTNDILKRMPNLLRILPQVFNYIEVALWPAMGLILAAYGLRQRGGVRRDCLLASVVLVAFGASDWFEANTGNEWWHPWWLFLWKAACVLALLALVALAWRRRPKDDVRAECSERGSRRQISRGPTSNQ